MTLNVKKKHFMYLCVQQFSARFWRVRHDRVVYATSGQNHFVWMKTQAACWAGAAIANKAFVQFDRVHMLALEVVHVDTLISRTAATKMKLLTVPIKRNRKNTLNKICKLFYQANTSAYSCTAKADILGDVWITFTALFFLRSKYLISPDEEPVTTNGLELSHFLKETPRIQELCSLQVDTFASLGGSLLSNIRTEPSPQPITIIFPTNNCLHFDYFNVCFRFSKFF